MNCESKYKDRMECIHCGWGHKNPLINRNCPKLMPPKVKVERSPQIYDNLSLLHKALNFGKAVVKDVATGMKRCSDEEIERRLSICKECPFYIETADGGDCSACGCKLSSKRIYMNKLAWSSEKCPKGKW